MAWMLDTHALIWALFEPGRLGQRTREVISEPANRILVSPVSYWEISLKHGLGKLDLPNTDPSEIPEAAAQLGLKESQLQSEVVSTYHRLPPVPDHRDPFDRLLIWQCIVGKHTLLSRDTSLLFYREHGLEFEW